MAGGFLNLVANGNQNIILNGNPTKTFFKAKYAKHTNFGMQRFRIDYNGLRTLRLTEESHFEFKIPRYSDLLMDTFIVITLPNIWSPISPPRTEDEQWVGYDFKWIENIGFELIKEISISVGGQVLQKYSGSYLRNTINRDADDTKKKLLNEMIGNTSEFYDPANSNERNNAYPCAFYTDSVTGAHPSIGSRKLYIPLNSWFMGSSKVAFPLIALQYNELVINVTMRPIHELYTVRDVRDHTNLYPYIQPNYTSNYMQFYRFLQTPPSVELNAEDYEDKRTLWNADIHLLGTYAFLSDDESRKMSKQSHSYLVKDVQTYTFKNVTGTKRLELESNGLVSSWMFYFQRSDINLRNEWSNQTNWPYNFQPYNVSFAPAIGNYKYPSYDVSSNYFESYYKNGFGPGINPNGQNTSLMMTGNYTPQNDKEILKEFGVLLDGNFRENRMDRGVFEYIEPYTHSQGSSKDGCYFYNFCLNTDPKEYQPSGAINMAHFKKVELEVSTISPPLDENAELLTICDDAGNVIGVNKPTWNIYQYNYDFIVHEERFNVINFQSGQCALMFAR